MTNLPGFGIALLALAALGLAGLLVAWLIRYVGGGKGRAGSASGDTSSTSGALPGDSAEAAPRELLRVVCDDDGNTTVTVDGTSYARLRQIKDPVVGRAAVDGVQAVLLFAEDLLPSALKRSLRSKKEPAARAPEGNMTAAPVSADELAALTPRQLCDQIDELVRQRIKDKPDMAGRGIRIREGKRGGLVIFVDKQSFDSVDRVPDEAVRQLIQDAIKEWEQR
ncbi:MAG: hypothetical protein E3J64_07220 [Anaerolineales bacterium]|nr:MAG: hypothetical protein E3J64_07220 [Anaerolineales bacterium]